MDLMCGLDASGSGYGPVAGSCERGNEPSDSIKDEEFSTSFVTVSFSRRTLHHGLVSKLVIFPYLCVALVICTKEFHPCYLYPSLIVSAINEAQGHGVTSGVVPSIVIILICANITQHSDKSYSFRCLPNTGNVAPTSANSQLLYRPKYATSNFNRFRCCQDGGSPLHTN